MQIVYFYFVSIKKHYLCIFGKVGVEIVAYGTDTINNEDFFEKVGLYIKDRITDIPSTFSNDYTIGYTFVCVLNDKKDVLEKMLPNEMFSETDGFLYYIPELSQ